ncbi:MAG: hypothetical protein Q4P20_09900 [Eubacteriales bacterium]|nr:hypothetical protein [Eubacteriales bacterium]
MPKYTKCLTLYEFDYETDNAKTTAFNVGRFLNDNWDKVDAAILNILESASGMNRSDITIPVSSWITDTVYPYHCDVPCAGVDAEMIPLLTILPESMAVAQDCGMASCAQTLDGFLRVYAETIPAEPIQVSLALLGVKPTIDAEEGE